MLDDESFLVHSALDLLALLILKFDLILVYLNPLNHTNFSVLEDCDDGHNGAPEDDLTVDQDDSGLKVHVYLLGLLEELKASEHRCCQDQVEEIDRTAYQVKKQHHLH